MQRLRERAVAEYLKLDSTRVSYGEYWRWKPGPVFPIVAVCKLLRLRFPATMLVPAEASVELVAPGGQPRELVEMLEQPVKVCLERGYAISFWYTIPMLGNVAGLAAALAASDGLSVASAMAAQTKDGLNREVHLGLVSRLATGRYLGTSDGGSVFDPPPQIDGLTLRRRPFPEVVAAHERRVAERRNEVVPLVDIREVVREIEQLAVDSNVARGIYVPASTQEVWKAMQRHPG